MLAEIFVQIR